MDMHERTEPRMWRRIGVSLALTALAACGDEGNVGYTAAPCIGDDTDCTNVPDLIEATVDVPREVVLGTLPTLEAAWKVPDVVGSSIALGSNGTTWFFAGDIMSDRVLVTQIDATGAPIGNAEVLAPSDLRCPSGGVNWAVSDVPGPSVLASWITCDGRTRQEILTFGATAGEPPHRQELPRVAADNVPMALRRSPDSADYAVIGSSTLGLLPARVGMGGLQWQQTAFVRSEDFGLNPPWTTVPILTFGTNNTVLAFGWFDQHHQGDGTPSLGIDVLTLVEMNWDNGNVLSRLHVPLDRSSFMRHVWDAQSRVVIAQDTEEGEIVWSRLQGTTLSSVLLVRTTFTLLSAHALVADTVGATYLLTESGDRGVALPTLCRMDEDQEVACVVLADATLAYDLMAGDQPGVVYLRVVDKQGNELTFNRYDFPL